MLPAWAGHDVLDRGPRRRDRRARGRRPVAGVQLRCRRGVGAAGCRRRCDAVVHRPPLRLARLELLAEGATPADALAELRAPDELEEFRQVAVLSADGRTEQWTGARCVPAAGGVVGDGWAAQGNMLASSTVWEAMGEAFAVSTGPLRRATHAGPGGGAGRRWRLAWLRRCRDRRRARDRRAVGSEVVDLRVEDGDESLVELRELLERALAYRATNRATEGPRLARRRAGPARTSRPVARTRGRRRRGALRGRRDAARRARRGGAALARRTRDDQRTAGRGDAGPAPRATRVSR